MPPPFNFHHERTPKSASGGIIGAFKNLTGQRREPQTSPETLSPPNGSHRPSSSHLETPSKHSKARLQRGLTEPVILKSFDEDEKQDGLTNGSLPGAWPELDPLLELLNHEHSAVDRAKAARAIVPLIRDYSVDDIGSIWRMATDMLDRSPESELHVAALDLFKMCIMSQSLTQPDKRLFFDTLSRQLISRASECTQCLVILTDDCRDFDGLDMGKVANLLMRLLKTTWDATIAARRRIKGEKSGSSATENTQLQEAVDVVADSIKYSAHMFSDPQLGIIMSQVLTICKKTSVESDLQHSLRIIETVITYSTFPSDMLEDFVEAICAMYASVPGLKDTTRDTIWKLLGSHHALAVMDQLYRVLGESSEDDSNHLAALTMRGAVQVFTTILYCPNEERTPQPDLKKLLSQLPKTLDFLSKSLEIDVLDLLIRLVDSANDFNFILDSEAWNGFSETFSRCASGSNVKDVNDSSVSEISLIDKAKGLEGESLPFGDKLRHVAGALFEQCRPVDGNYDTDSPDLVDPDFDRTRSIMTVLLRVANLLEEQMARVVVHYVDVNQLHIPPKDTWVDICSYLGNALLRDSRRPQELRITAIRLLSKAYSTAFAFGLRESQKVLNDLMKAVSCKMDSNVLQPLIEVLVDVAIWTDDTDLFFNIATHLHDTLLTHRSATSNLYGFAALRALELDSRMRLNVAQPDSAPVKIAKGLVCLFLRTVNRSFAKANRLYGSLLEIARSSTPPADARIIALKALVRLRGDINHGIYVVAHTESESLAAALCRTADSAVLAHINQSPATQPVRADESQTRKSQGASSSQEVSRSNSRTGRQGTQTSRMTQPTPPLWVYPGPKGLPEDPYPYASHCVYSYLDDEAQGEGVLDSHKGVLNIASWLETVTELINSNTVDWEIFSYLIVHLGGQLSNHSLFVDAIPHIKLLRRTICDKLNQRNYIEPPAFTHLKKSDAAVCFYQILTTLISYSNHFHKDEEQDPMVKSFVFGIGTWDRSVTSEVCIHGLSICCHELPSILVRYLENALQKMTQIIAQSNVAASILDFFATLARLPELFRNFSEDNFKNVFGICFRYLQFVRDQRSRQLEQTGGRSGRNRDSSLRPSRDITSPVDNTTSSSQLGEALPQYVYALTFHAMTFWFMALKLQDRGKHISWIVQNLVYKDEHGKEVLEEQAEVTIDMMYRVAYSDRDETAPNPDFAKLSDGMVISRDYLVGASLLTIETAGRSGLTHITRRRPSGTVYSMYSPQIVPPPRHQAPITIGLAADAFNDSDYVGVTADHIMQNLYAPLSGDPSLDSHSVGPVLLPEDDATRRAIGTFDRIPALDGHKVGIIYVGERQTTEPAILSNVAGSKDYMSFLNGIGTLMELKDAKFNTQGLDREFDTDGKFTYAWRDRVTELVFHVTTMMPTNLEHDPHCGLKKRHIGNDFVKIIFNNSGLAFDFDTFPSDFNYVNIVLTPEARASFVETRLHAAKNIGDKANEAFYKVTVMTRPDLPKISPASETKIISGSSLPTFVRLLALNASVFSQVWSSREGGEYVSSWRTRLKEIKKLREKHAAPTETPRASWAGTQDTGSSPPPASTTGDNDRTGPSRGSSLLRRTSLATFSNASGKRSSDVGGSTTGAELEQTSSNGSHEQ